MAPSPPSEKGSSSTLASGSTDTIPSLIENDTSVALKLSLKESGTIRIRM
jgi:hypothetical protein